MSHFADEVRIHIASGNGGHGCVSFRREKYVPRGGPDGGDGGRGGDVIIQVQRNLKTLTHLRNLAKYKGQDGQPGRGRGMSGLDGKDVVIPVPPGTRIIDIDTEEILLELLEDKTTHVLLKGGRGGQGNQHFATSRSQTPRYAQPGLSGESRDVVVELNLIADIGFLGLPNAGKSSLLKVLTQANPKVAAYPFTTKIPNLGVMPIFDSELVLADIPGIIEGAHEGAGLGIQFLKHVRRSAGLAVIIDMSGEEDPVEVFHTLIAEASAFAPELADRPRIVVASKMDLPESEETYAKFSGQLPDERIIRISSHTGQGLPDLSQAFWDLAHPKVEDPLA